MPTLCQSPRQALPSLCIPISPPQGLVPRAGCTSPRGDHRRRPDRQLALPTTRAPLSGAPSCKQEAGCEAALCTPLTPQSICPPQQFLITFCGSWPSQETFAVWKLHRPCNPSSRAALLSRVNQSGKPLELWVGNGKMFSGSQHCQTEQENKIKRKHRDDQDLVSVLSHSSSGLSKHCPGAHPE